MPHGDSLRRAVAIGVRSSRGSTDFVARRVRDPGILGMEERALSTAAELRRNLGAKQAAEKCPATNNHPGAQGATPPDSGGELRRNSPPQMRRGGAPSAGVVLTVLAPSATEFFRSLFSPAVRGPF